LTRVAAKREGLAEAASAALTGLLTLYVLPWLRTAEGPPCPLHQIGLDEGVEVPVKDSIDVADLHLRAVVLDHLVGLQHVAANLTAESDAALLATEPFETDLLFL